MVIKTVVWSIFLFCLVGSLCLLTAIFFVSTYFKEANLYKVLLIDAGLVVIAFAVFILGLGALEFVREVDKVEKKVEEIEGKISHNTSKNKIEKEVS